MKRCYFMLVAILLLLSLFTSCNLDSALSPSPSPKVTPENSAEIVCTKFLVNDEDLYQTNAYTIDGSEGFFVYNLVDGNKELHIDFDVNIPNATITYENADNLSAGENLITIKAVAPDNTQRLFSLLVYNYNESDINAYNLYTQACYIFWLREPPFEIDTNNTIISSLLYYEL